MLLNSIASCDTSNLILLQKIHPQAPPDRRKAPLLTVQPLYTTAAAVDSALHAFPSGSAGGPDELRPQHLKDLLSGIGISREIGNRGGGKHPLLNQIMALINVLLSGEVVPGEVRRVLYSGSLIALNKKVGGFRPIAMGLTWRRLAAKICVRHSLNSATELLAPRQLGFGVKGGAEAAAHATRRYMQDMPNDHILVKLDFKNAFNTMRRDVILESFGKHFPELPHFGTATYNIDSTLHFGGYTLPSSEGVQQGNPLGLLYFCLGIHYFLQAAQAEFVIGYLDDITIGGPVNTVISDLHRMEQAAHSVGLALNQAKSEVIGGSSHSLCLLHTASFTFNEIDEASACLCGALLDCAGVDAALALKQCDLDSLIACLSI